MLGIKARAVLERVRLRDAPPDELPAAEVAEVAHVRVREQPRRVPGGRRELADARDVALQCARGRRGELGSDWVRLPLVFGDLEEGADVGR